MARAAAQQRPPWTMHVHFEPTRLPAAPLVEAYEAALPLQRHRPIPAPPLAGHGQQDDAGRRA